MKKRTDKEDQMYMEAFEVLLQTWSVVLQETSSRVPYTSFTIVSAAVGLSSPTSSSPNNNNESNNGNSDLLASLKVKTKQHSTVIFDTYLKSHLAPPEGSRRQLENEEITEAEQSDRVLYMDQLLLIGVCARENVEHCVPILTELLEQRVTMLRSYLGQALQQQQTQQHLIDNLYEDLNWLLLITCNVITTDGDGGDSLVIPPELVLYSIASSPHTDVQATLALLAAPHTMPADMNKPFMFNTVESFGEIKQKQESDVLIVNVTVYFLGDVKQRILSAAMFSVSILVWMKTQQTLPKPLISSVTKELETKAAPRLTANEKLHNPHSGVHKALPEWSTKLTTENPNVQLNSVRGILNTQAHTGPTASATPASNKRGETTNNEEDCQSTA
ncbi:hypothetical protein FHG87_011358 [Trinorchestia longiramus]|nr:hypothetical protein FHG87_011358 [Trinorchestia longiramus]